MGRWQSERLTEGRARQEQPFESHPTPAPSPTNPSTILRMVPLPTAARQGGKRGLPVPGVAAMATPMRTRLTICRKKKRFPSEADAIAAAHIATIELRP